MNDTAGKISALKVREVATIYWDSNARILWVRTWFSSGAAEWDTKFEWSDASDEEVKAIEIAVKGLRDRLLLTYGGGS